MGILAKYLTSLRFCRNVHISYGAMETHNEQMKLLIMCRTRTIQKSTGYNQLQDAENLKTHYIKPSRKPIPKPNGEDFIRNSKMRHQEPRPY